MFIFKKGHDSRAIANHIVDLSIAGKKNINLEQLMQFVYISHGWVLACTNKPLIKDKIHANRDGALLKPIKKSFEKNKNITKKAIETDPVFGRLSFFTANLTSTERNLIRRMFNYYSKYNPYELNEEIQEINSPWCKCFDYKKNSIISNNNIKDYYKNLFIQNKGIYSTI